MMKNHVVLVVAAAAFAVLPSLAMAEGTTCANPTYVVPDGRVVTSSIPAGATYYLYYLNNAAPANTRSYVFEVRNATNIWNQGFTVNAYSDIGVCTIAVSPAPTNVTTVDPELHSSSAQRLAFLHPGTGVEFAVANTSGVTLTYQFSISETTMFSAAWSTGGTYDTYYSFQNTTGNACNVALTLLDTAGTVRTTASSTVASGATFSTNTQALGTARGFTGTARLTHNCPPGAILATAAIANFTISPTPYFQPVEFRSVRPAP